MTTTRPHWPLPAALLGDDADFWEHVGIDPVRVMAGGGTVSTPCAATGTISRASLPQRPHQRFPVGAGRWRATSPTSMTTTCRI